MMKKFMVAVILLVALASAEHIALESRSHAQFDPFQSAEWKHQGRSLESEKLKLHFMLKQRNLDGFEKHVNSIYDRSSQNFLNFLSNEEIREFIAPSTKDIKHVMKYLEKHGAHDFHLAQTGDILSCSLRVKDAQEIFHGKFHSFRHVSSGSIIHRMPFGYTVPNHIAKHLDLVGGLVRFPSATVVVEENRAILGGDNYTTPQTIYERYNVVVPPVTGKQTQAIASFLGQYVNFSDLKIFFQKVVGSTPIDVAKVVGPNDESKPGVEASLDIQYLMGLSGANAPTWIWSTDGLHATQEPFFQWMEDVFSYEEEVPKLFSISYQDLEDTVSNEYMVRVDAEFQKAASKGIHLSTGSGDWGTQCTTTCDRFRPDFPSSSPWIMSTGATQWKWSGEKVVDESATSWSSGGFSNVFQMPKYQKDVVEKFLQITKTPTSYFNTTTRAFPDVGMIGSNFEIVVNGNTRTVGGTSAATPAFAALITLLNELRIAAGKPAMGFANPFMYWAYAQNPGAFIDIVEGNNKWGCCQYGFDCVKGWDPVTGLGVPNFSELARLALQY